ncbi:MAG: phage virion morphogenesis protein [Bacteroidales bacterium]|uniref:phage virion morphogenesis protein n=1 Tax=Porphyromonas sp. TaxID=1924944 RepID=UPI0029737EA0|nr:phage virion morphogenesis protein [Porphyromonas sp.]MDD7438590.1 phage virion morphogenesis protein [Bacteroidales bacterium]MDY3067846.1 phage virion morphogenesis protein [Porphyromonas sp.]
MEKKQQELQEFMRSQALKDIVGTEAVNHYKRSFEDEGFTDETLNPWKEVERRNPESPWFGHSGQTGKFSLERTSAPILSGETGELKNAIRYTYLPDGVRVSNSAPYAAVHQYGLPAKIYGKKPFTMTPRPFIGRSKALKRNIEDKIKRQMLDIIKK